MKYPDFDGSQPCASIGTEIFFATDDQYNGFTDYRPAKRVCSSCHFLAECAEYALHHVSDGVWGGMTPNERVHMRARRRIRMEPNYTEWLPPVRNYDKETA